MSIQLGAALSAQRTAHHLSQADLATQLQVSPQTVADWETNRRQPALAALVKLSQVLAVPVQDLVGIHSPQPTKRHWWHPFAWNATEKIVPWYASGHQRAEVAIAMLIQLLADVPSDQTELRAILADHYQQIMAQVTSVPYVLQSLELQVAGCLHRTHYQFAPADEQAFARLLALSHIRGSLT